MQACFLPADILLPDAAADVEKWAVVACDQFTSQMEYWQKAAQIVGDAPSTLNIVYPEVYLAEGDARIERIRRAMADYMQRGVLQTRVKNGFVFVRRVTESGERLGLVGKLDLEQYDFTPGTSAPVRATEGTILSRIPPRVRRRRGKHQSGVPRGRGLPGDGHSDDDGPHLSGGAYAQERHDDYRRCG